MPKPDYTLSDFDYHLPEKLIAQVPAEPRDHSRLLVYDRNSGSITDAHFYQIGDFLHKGTTLVMNNSRVEKARLLFGRMEVFVVHSVNDRTVEVMVRPGKKFRLDKVVELAPGIAAEVVSIAGDGLRTLRFNQPLDSPVFGPYRQTPFPPYIKPDEKLSERYQTVYARPEGSKAAPTAGLHFTPGLLSALTDQGFGMAEVTLHVGLGTFAPVKTEDIAGHKLHSEEWHLDPIAAGKINQAKHITAIGTTSSRVLESLPDRPVRPGSGSTEIFIRPGAYGFRYVDSMVTNFHLPKSTLLMMVAAFMGYEEMRSVYAHAIREGYRFYSFGDAMLIL